MDLEKLTPAPWEFGYEDEGPHCLLGSQAMFWCRIVDSPGRSAATDAKFIALARQAFDVMMRRRWAATPFSPGDKWGLDPEIFSDNGTEANTPAFIDWIYRNVFADPFTALVAADEWFKANVEKSGN